MKLHKLTLVCCLLLCSLPALGRAKDSINPVQQIVDQEFPYEVIGRPRIPSLQKSCFVVYDTFPDGSPKLIAAAYTSGSKGDLRMLSAAQDGAVRVIGEVTDADLLLGGGGCQLSLVDMNAETTSEVPSLARVLQLGFYGTSGRGEEDWFFQWDGSQFVNLGPVAPIPGGILAPQTQLNNAGVGNLDHSDIKQIVSIGGDGDFHRGEDGIWDTTSTLVWKYNGSSFQLERTLTFLASFERKNGKPTPVNNNLTPDQCFQPNCREFELRSPTAQYKLTVVNGSCKNKNRVSSGHVLLNNKEVVSASDFNQQVEFISKTVTLRQKNTLYVSLESKPGGTIYVTLEPISSR